MSKKIPAALALLALLCIIGLFKRPPSKKPPFPRQAFLFAAQELGRAWTLGRHPRSRSADCSQLFASWPAPPEILNATPFF